MATLYYNHGVGILQKVTPVAHTDKPAYEAGKKQAHGFSAQFSSISFFPKFQTRFGSGSNGEFIPYENESWGPAYDGSMVKLGKPLEDGSQQEVPYAPIKNNRKKFFDTGVTLQTDLSYAAKNFYFSFQDAHIKGILPGDKNRRSGVRMNAAKEYKNFKISFGSNYIQHNYDIYNSEEMYQFYRSKNLGMHDGVMDMVFATQAHVPLKSYKDFRNNKWATYDNYYCEYSQNPYFVIDNWRTKGVRHELLTNADLALKITDWLDINYRVALTYYSLNTKTKTKQVTPSPWAEKNRGFHFIPQGVNEGLRTSTRISSEPYIKIHKEFEDFKLNAILGSYLRETRFKRINVGASPLSIEGLFNISGRSGEPQASHREEMIRTASVYGSLAVGYKNFLNLEFTGRRDKTSLLAKDNNTYFYPGVNASAILTDAFPILKSDIFNFFKLRASWNKTGNVDIAPYLLDPIYVQNRDRIETGFPYEGLPGYFSEITLTDPDLKPEFIDSWEFGFEASFWKSRLTLDATYYTQKNTDQIIGIRVPRPTGYTFSRVNAASFRNYGFEISFKANPLLKINDVDINLGISYSYNDSEILSLNEDNTEFSVGGYFMASTNAVVGKPAFIISAKDYKRDPEGRVIVDKRTGIPQIDESNKLFGRTMPKHIVGVSPSVTWKNLTVSSVFEYKGGHYSFNYQGTTMAWDGTSRITAANDRERFVFPNSVYKEGDTYVPNTNITINSCYEFFHGDNYRSIGTNMLFSASAWRWRELSISYSIPKNWLNFQNTIEKIDIAFTGKNLMLWLPDSNEWSDPDFSVYDDNVGSIITSAINPPTRVLGWNLTIQF